jgi:Ca2+-transporting ATPase
MDTFAAFALATEEPLDSVLSGEPYKEDTNVLTPAIWRQIIGITFWNLSIMLFIMIFGPIIAGLEYNYTTAANDSGDMGEAKLKMCTILFNTFVFLQIFNEINCRKIDRRDFNIFEGIHKNFYFLIVVIGTFLA